MRTLRLTVLAMAVLSLLAGTASVAFAQTEFGGNETPVGVEIDVTWQSKIDGGEVEMAGEPGAAWSKLHDVTLAWRWEATDPRLSGEATSLMTLSAYPLHGGHEITAIEYALANDGGSWVGAGTGIWPGGLDREGAESMILHGDGDYEGLTVYLTRSCPQDCPDSAHRTLHGLVVAEALPPFPEVPAE